MSNEANSTALLSNKTYDLLKNIVQLILPAFGALYLSLAGTWGLPAADKVVATSAALAVFLGVILRISSKTFVPESDRFDGEVVVNDNGDGGYVFTLELDGDPNDIPDQDSIRFKVVHRESDE